MCSPPNVVIRNGIGKCTGCLNHGIVPKTCIYFADIELVRYIHTHLPVDISMLVQCLGEERIFLLTRVNLLNCIKILFLGGPCKVAVDLGDTLYHHTPFYIRVEVLQGQHCHSYKWQL